MHFLNEALPMTVDEFAVRNLKGKKILVMGLGLFGGGAGVARFLVSRGARVTVTDLKGEEDLQESLEALKGLPIRYKLGGHEEEDFKDADMIIVNPAVPRDSKFLEIARKEEVVLEAEMNLFFKLCQGRIIGITGTNGKSTVTALVGEILKQFRPGTWVGGNIGRSLLEDVEKIGEDDLVVLELSSFQLEDLGEIKKSPEVAVVTNLSPNHLDRHKRMENYISAKKNILRFQQPGDFAILNWDDAEVRGWREECKSQVIFVSTKQELQEGIFLYHRRGARGEEICEILVRLKGREEVLDVLKDFRLPGRHNLENAVLAAAAAYILNAKEEDIRAGLCQFKGLEHRLEPVAEIGGVKYYNDSIATTPEATIAALSALSGPIILIAGGYDKGLVFDNLAQEIGRRVKACVLLGQTGPKIKKAIEQAKKPSPKIREVSSLTEAVEAARLMAKPGDIVLLSPASASYDMFRNFADRGKQFKELVRKIEHP